MNKSIEEPPAPLVSTEIDEDSSGQEYDLNIYLVTGHFWV